MGHVIGVLECISFGENLNLRGADGKSTFANSQDLFSSVDEELVSLSSASGDATGLTSFSVFKLIDEVNLITMIEPFLSREDVNGDLKRLCFSEHQIIDISQRHRKWLALDKSFDFNFMLCKSGTEFFFVAVSATSSGDKLVLEKFGIDSTDYWASTDDGEVRMILPLW